MVRSGSDTQVPEGPSSWSRSPASRGFNESRCVSLLDVLDLLDAVQVMKLSTSSKSMFLMTSRWGDDRTAIRNRTLPDGQIRLPRDQGDRAALPWPALRPRQGPAGQVCEGPRERARALRGCVDGGHCGPKLGAEGEEGEAFMKQTRHSAALPFSGSRPSLPACPFPGRCCECFDRSVTRGTLGDDGATTAGIPGRGEPARLPQQAPVHRAPDPWFEIGATGHVDLPGRRGVAVHEQVGRPVVPRASKPSDDFLDPARRDLLVQPHGARRDPGVHSAPVRGQQLLHERRVTVDLSDVRPRPEPGPVLPIGSLGGQSDGQGGGLVHGHVLAGAIHEVDVHMSGHLSPFFRRLRKGAGRAESDGPSLPQ